MDELRLEDLLANVLQPVDPPERLSTRFRGTFSAISDAAATDLSDWADELTESEMRSLRDPRNWVRPVIAVAAGGVATGALVVLEYRRRGRQRPSRIESLVKGTRSRTGL
ncbi:MAG: hypothetical protein ACSLFD_04620 [Solirubrobacterales bacterium]